MFVIRNDQGELLHKQADDLPDPRATEEPDSDEPIKPGVVWARRLEGAINTLADFYPCFIDAEPMDTADPEVEAFRAKCLEDAERQTARRAAMQAALEKLADAELAAAQPTA